MDKLTAIKIKYDDGTYSDEIPVSVLAENVEWDSTHTLVDVLGSIDVDVTGTIQDQISQLFNEKVSASELNKYVASQLNIDVTKWLNDNVNPVGSAITIDKSLNIEGSAADAKIVGELNQYYGRILYSFAGTDQTTNYYPHSYNKITLEAGKYYIQIRKMNTTIKNTDCQILFNKGANLNSADIIKTFHVTNANNNSVIEVDISEEEASQITYFNFRTTNSYKSSLFCDIFLIKDLQQETLIPKFDQYDFLLSDYVYYNFYRNPLE